MFDELPQNLPVEPGKAPPPRTPAGAPPAMPRPMPPAPAEPGSSRPKEPEDIFSGMDDEERRSGQVAEAMQTVSERKGSVGKSIGIFFIVLLIVAVAAAALWYFLIREAPLPTFEPESAADVIVETPPTLPPEQTVPPTLPPPEAIETEEPAPVVPEPEAPVVVPEAAAVPAPDTDNDGLTNPEETVFGTSILIADSDQDSFTDAEEVRNGYDPAAPGSRLEQSGRFRFVEFQELWRVLLPVSWTLLSDPVIPADILIETATPNTVGIHVDQKPLEMPFSDWLASTDPSTDPDALLSFISKAGVAGWRTPDGRTVYLASGTMVLVARYRTGGSGSIDYPIIFEHMIQTVQPVQ